MKKIFLGILLVLLTFFVGKTAAQSDTHIDGCDRHFESAVKFVVDTPVIHYFSVSNSKCNPPVIFSRGNLQYNAVKDEWRFALRQFDRCGNYQTANPPAGSGYATPSTGITTVFYDSIDFSTPDATTKSGYKEISGIPCDNMRVSKNYEGWIDLFSWGTSGWGKRAGDPAAVYFQPYDLNADYIASTNKYGFGPSCSPLGTLLTPFIWFDWGYNNHIREYSGCSHDANGLVLHVHDSTMYYKDIWRTLTPEEWEYMLTTRIVDGKQNPYSWVRIKYGEYATDTVTGVVIYPDDFTFAEAGVGDLPFGANNTVTEVSATTWEALEKAGCVFLPTTGTRSFDNFVTTDLGGTATYWTANAGDAENAYTVSFQIAGKSLLTKSAAQRNFGLPVRLVQGQRSRIEHRSYSAELTDCSYLWDLGDRTLSISLKKEGDTLCYDTVRTIIGCDSIISVLSLTKKIPVRTYSANIMYDCSYTFNLGGGATRTFTLKKDGTQKLHDTLRVGDCDTAIVDLTVTKKIPVRTYSHAIDGNKESYNSYTFDLGGGVTRTLTFSSLTDGLPSSGTVATKKLRDTLRNGDCDTAIVDLTVTRTVRKLTLTSYATNDYTVTWGSFSRTFTLSDSSHLINAKKTYNWLLADTAGLIIELTRTPKAFSVSASRKVAFSPGNLNSATQFVRYTYEYGAYLAAASTYGNVAIKDGNSSVSYAANYWRMLTRDEWNYLLKTRSTDYDRYVIATVNGVKGMIVYPDDYTPWNAGFASGIGINANVSTDDWRKMQMLGCVFLPCVGYKSGSYVGNVDEQGCYWTSSIQGSSTPINLEFDKNGCSFTPYKWDYSLSVRLVRNL